MSPRWTAFLDRHRLSIPEFHVLHFVQYGDQQPKDIIAVSAAESEIWGARLRSASRAECAEALGTLIARGLLQVVDEGSLGRIQAELAAAPAFGPFYSLPEVGAIDFTREGAAVWLDGYPQPKETYSGSGDQETMVYLGTSEQEILRALPADDPRILSIGNPEAIGPWCAHWWEPRYEAGVRIVVTYHPDPVG